MAPRWGPSDDIFASRSPHRKLRIVWDEDTASSLTPDVGLLGKIVTRDSIDLLRYTDTGPPPHVSVATSGSLGPHATGWAIVRAPDPAGNRLVTWSNGSSTTQGIIPVAKLEQSIASQPARTSVPQGVLGLLVAETVGADIFVTQRSVVVPNLLELVDGVTVCRPDQALALIGLYLRCQGEYWAWEPGATDLLKVTRGLYYWVGARTLVPATWPWFHAACQQSRGEANDDLMLLAQSAIERIQRALQYRDEFHRAMNQRPNADTADAALAAVDVTLLLLMGALDASARVAHITLGLHGSPRDAGWQSGKWLKTVRKEASALADVAGNGSPGQHVMTTLTTLRNSIHSQGLQPVGLGRPFRDPNDILIRLPHGAWDRLRDPIDSLGGPVVWGVRPAAHGGDAFLEPVRLLESLFPRVLVLLNDFMLRTPVNRLAYVHLAPEHFEPTGIEFHPNTRDSILWLLGLRDQGV